jgi:sugar lactone lactonase YvrE
VGFSLVLVAVACVLSELVLRSRTPNDPGDQEASAREVETPEPALPTEPDQPELLGQPSRLPPLSAPLVRPDEFLAVMPRLERPAPPAAVQDERLAVMPRLVTPERPAVVKVETPRPPTENPPVEKPVVETTKAPEKLVVKRRHETTEDDLRKQIEKVPEVTLYKTFTRADALRTAQAAVLLARAGKPTHETSLAPFLKRPDLAGLPMRMGEACKLSPTAADHLQGGSVGLRAHLTEAKPAGATRVVGAAGFDPRPDPKILHQRLLADKNKYNKWLKPEAIPVMQQMLMAENESIREVLIEQLARIDGQAASIALAQRALFDLHPRVREQALKALQKRPAKEYQQTLLDGFQYPWPAVADHAAEAVIALQMKDTVPALLTFLDKPDPSAPFQKPGKGIYTREMIKINHPRNCLLCHAQSISTEDKVRGQVPTTDQSLTPPYYGGTQGTFVRADVTYLKQDFSVPLNVPNPGAWPSAQRFDFLVRERPARPAEIFAAKKPALTASVYQQSVFFALRELTGQDPGPTAEDWKKLLLKRTLSAKPRYRGFENARALAVDDKGRAFVADKGQVLLQEGTDKPSVWLKDAGAVALALDGKGRLLAADGRNKRVIRIDESRAVTTLATKVTSKPFAGHPFSGPSRLVADDKGGFYLTDAGGRQGSALCYVSALGSVTKLAIDLSAPGGLALAPDNKTLYVASAVAPVVLAIPVESAGNLRKGREFCKIAAPPGVGVADLAVDRAGAVYALNTARQSVEVFTPEGQKAGAAKLPGAPSACAVGGPGKQTLYVLTATSLVAIALEKEERTAGR